MRKRPFSTRPWMALAAVAMSAASFAQVRSADVAFTYRANQTQPGFRLGDECFVPVETLNSFGWNVFLRDSQAEVKVDGRVTKVGISTVADRRMIPLRQLIGRIGGGTEWGPQDRLIVFSTLKSVERKGDTLNAQLSLPVDITPVITNDEKALVFDLRGARVDAKFRSPQGVQVAQIGPQTIRLSIDTKSEALLDNKSLRPTNALRLTWKRRDAAIAATVPIKSTPVTPPVTPPRDITTEPAQDVVPPQPDERDNGRIARGALPLTLVFQGATTSALSIGLKGYRFGEPRIVRSDPLVLEILIPQTEFKGVDPGTYGDYVRSVETESTDEGTLVRFILSRPTGIELTSDTEGIRLDLMRIGQSSGLFGKVIVVDAGHGGHDMGANRVGVMEKNVTLAVAKRLSDGLTAEGARVIMTRDRDVYLTLTQRSNIAKKNRADIFISCHINSSASDEKMSGTITFHHKGRVEGQRLAQAIHRRLVPAIKLPNIGVWSDGRIYKTGFAVLRQTPMPGVLLELGFVNHSRDRARMTQPDFAATAAAAIVRGVQDYFSNAR